MYTPLACFVLFDARGNDDVPLSMVVYVAFAFQLLCLGLTYFPLIFYRQQHVDTLCADLITHATHAAGILLAISDPRLVYACALHSLCFCIQHHVLHRVQLPIVVHSAAALLLMAAYWNGPRIADIRQYVIGVVSPFVWDLVAVLLVHVHKFLVSWVSMEI